MNEEEPLEAVVAEIRVHLRDVHAHEGFDPELHVTWPGHVPDGAVATYIRETPRHPAGFVCVLCGARVFPVGNEEERAQALLPAEQVLGERKRRKEKSQWLNRLSEQRFAERKANHVNTFQVSTA